MLAGDAMNRKLADSLAYPPRALRADRAAAYLSMSTSFFLEMVKRGRLPKPKKLAGKFQFWDRLALDEFVEHYKGEPEDTRNDLEKALGFDT
jgi:predicted DNA-binding transcriptional regulator AlpA